MTKYVRLSQEELRTSISVQSGTIRTAAINLYSIMRNEMYFLPAFLQHYRKLGVEQFFLLDDNSSDGSREFIARQDDCVLLGSKFGFGEKIIVRLDDGSELSDRAGTHLKRAIPERFILGNWAVYVDADEFLVLPPDVADLKCLIKRLNKEGINSIAATLIDFFPATLDHLQNRLNPQTFEDLISQTPYFDAVPFLRISGGRQPQLVGETSSSRLFRTHDVHEVPPVFSFLPQRLKALFPTPRAAWFKTPIIRWDSKTWLNGSHMANIPPPPAPVLALIHFKFTSDFLRRIGEAIERKSHARKSGKYRQYKIMIERLKENGGNFLGPDSKEYHSADDLVRAGLLVPLP